MSLKSSLAVCMGIVLCRSPKCASKALATSGVVSGSLSVNGKRSNNSNSGSFGDLEAWHSAAAFPAAEPADGCGDGGRLMRRSRHGRHEPNCTVSVVRILAEKGAHKSDNWHFLMTLCPYDSSGRCREH